MSCISPTEDMEVKPAAARRSPRWEYLIHVNNTNIGFTSHINRTGIDVITPFNYSMWLLVEVRLIHLISFPLLICHFPLIGLADYSQSWNISYCGEVCTNNNVEASLYEKKFCQPGFYPAIFWSVFRCGVQCMVICIYREIVHFCRTTLIVLINTNNFSTLVLTKTTRGHISQLLNSFTVEILSSKSVRDFNTRMKFSVNRTGEGDYYFYIYTIYHSILLCNGGRNVSNSVLHCS